MTEPVAEWDELKIGPFLRRLRGKMSLREAHRLSGVSSLSLSQIEGGNRRPGPPILRRLATLYGVALNDLLVRAGHLDDGKQARENDPLEAEDVEGAYQSVLADPKFRFGVRTRGPLSVEAKRYIVKMYERTTGNRLLE